MEFTRYNLQFSNVQFHDFSELYHWLTITNFHHPIKFSPAYIQPNLLPAWANTDVLPISTHLLFLDILYKWNHTMCSLLWMASFIYPNIFSVCSYCNMLMPHSFLLQIISIVTYVPHLPFKSSGNGHLGFPHSDYYLYCCFEQHIYVV